MLVGINGTNVSETKAMEVRSLVVGCEETIVLEVLRDSSAVIVSTIAVRIQKNEAGFGFSLFRVPPNRVKVG